MAEQTKNLSDFAGSCPPPPVPEGTTSREKVAAKWLHDAHRGYWGWEDAVVDARDLLAAIDGPEPTWRDVFREFLKIGPYLLERTSKDGNRYWRYETDVRTKGGLRELVDVLHFPTESMWIVKRGIYGSTHMVSLKNPTPAEVLTAARLVGLVGAS